MKLTTNILLALAVTAGLSNAAIIMQQSGATGSNSGGFAGQAFAVSDTGFTGDSPFTGLYDLNSVTFTTGHNNAIGTDSTTFLSVYTTGNVFVASSDNSINQNTIGNSALAVFNFTDAAVKGLDSATVYKYAFTADQGASGTVIGSRTRRSNSDNPLTTGRMLNTSLGEFTAGPDGISDLVFDVDITPVPEPSSTALLGLGGLALILRRRK